MKKPNSFVDRYSYCNCYANSSTDHAAWCNTFRFSAPKTAEFVDGSVQNLDEEMEPVEEEFIWTPNPAEFRIYLRVWRISLEFILQLERK